MGENIYGGISYPNTSFIFDKIYNSCADAAKGAATDNVLIGRYILVAYCETALPQDARTIIEFSNGQFSEDITNDEGSVLATKEDAAQYYENFVKDGKVSCDRKVYRKEYHEPEGFKYKEIACLSVTIGTNTIQYLKNCITEEAERATKAEQTIDGRLDSIIGEDSGQTIREIASDEVSKIVDNAPAAYDTLREIAEWIVNDKTGAAAMANAIADLDTRTKWIEV